VLAAVVKHAAVIAIVVLLMLCWQCSLWAHQKKKTTGNIFHKEDH